MNHRETKFDDASSLSVEHSLSQSVAVLLAQQDFVSDAEQLFSNLPLSGADVSEHLVDRALSRIGYRSIWTHRQEFPDISFPSALRLVSGKYLVAIGLEATDLVVLDPSDPSACRSIPLATISNRWDGTTLEILPSLDLMLRRHAGVINDGHWFWSKLLRFKSVLAEIIVASLFANILALVTSLFAMQVYDRVIPGQSTATLWVLACGVGLAILFEAILRIARATLVDRLGKDAEVEIYSELFERLMALRLDRRPAPPGALVHMVREFSAVKEFFTNVAVGVVADLPFALVFLTVIYAIAGHVVWVIIIGAVMIILPNLLSQNKLSQLSKEAMGGMSSASRVLTEVAYGSETVRLSRLEAYFQRQWEQIIGLNAIKTTEQRLLRAFLTYWAAAVQQLSYIFGVIVCVYLIFAGQLSTGAIIAVGILTTRTLSPISQLSQALASWQNMKTSLNALDAIMTADLERDPERQYIRKASVRGKVSLSKVRYGHPNSQTIALDVEGIDIPEGTHLGILGANGSGKSTFLRLVAGLQHATDGEVLIDGVDIRQIDPTDLRNNIGYLPQDIVLFRGTLRDNLAAGLNAKSDEELMKALEFAGLADFVSHHPQGLDIVINDGGGGLSSGQRQSIGLARVFLQDPSIVLLDEPTSAIDQNLELQLVPRLGKWLEGKTCVVATHRPQILAIVSSITVLHQGKVIAAGNRDAVLKQLSTGRSNSASEGTK